MVKKMDEKEGSRERQLEKLVEDVHGKLIANKAGGVGREGAEHDGADTAIHGENALLSDQLAGAVEETRVGASGRSLDAGLDDVGRDRHEPVADSSQSS